MKKNPRVFGSSASLIFRSEDKYFASSEGSSIQQLIIQTFANAGANAVVSVVIILGANDSKPYNWNPAAGKNDQQYLKDYLAMVDHFAGLSTKPTVYVTR